MPGEEITVKEELVSQIRNRIISITGDYNEMPVYLADVSFRSPGENGRKGRISICCLFVNEEGNICADMLRSGSAGCADFICGLKISSFEEKVLENIISSLDGNKWYVSDSTDVRVKKKKKFTSVVKMPFFKRGA